MKRVIICSVALLTTLQGASAQSFLSDLFGQDGKMRKNLLQQITALQVYDQYLQKGYDITRKGTGVISSFKDDDLLQFRAHFNSLQLVSASVRKYGRIQSIIDMNRSALERQRRVYPMLETSGRLTATELQACKNACQLMARKMNNCLTDLQAVITDHQLQLTDDQRIAAIDKLYRECSAISSSFNSYLDRCIGLVQTRKRNLDDINRMKSLQGF